MVTRTRAQCYLILQCLSCSYRVWPVLLPHFVILRASGLTRGTSSSETYIIRCWIRASNTTSLPHAFTLPVVCVTPWESARLLAAAVTRLCRSWSGLGQAALLCFSLGGNFCGRSEGACWVKHRTFVTCQWHTHSLTHSLTHTHSLTRSYTHTHILAHWHTLSLTHTHTLARSLTHSLSHTHTFAHSHTHTLSLTHPHSLSHSLTLTHTLHCLDSDIQPFSFAYPQLYFLFNFVPLKLLVHNSSYTMSIIYI
jgi:hypothetical protein